MWYPVAITSAFRLHRCGSYASTFAHIGRSPLSARPVRMISSGGSLVRPAPPPLPRDQQREFEELVRAAQAPLSVPGRRDTSQEEAEMALDPDRHPDARAPLPAEFDGDVNPVTGEQGGPKREPVGRWGEGDGDWSFKGRVSDF